MKPYDEVPKKKAQPKFDLKKIPAPLREKYQSMGLLPKEEPKKTKVEVDLEALKRKKIEKEKSIEEKLDEIQISATE